MAKELQYDWYQQKGQIVIVVYHKETDTNKLRNVEITEHSVKLQCYRFHLLVEGVGKSNLGR